jgi:hypothetical protein
MGIIEILTPQEAAKPVDVAGITESVVKSVETNQPPESNENGHAEQS